MVDGRTAAQAGWHVSCYNVTAWSRDLAPDGGDPVPVVANLFAGTLARSSLLEQALLQSLDQMPETHPILRRFKKLGWVVDFDELERIDEMARAASTEPPTTVNLMVCTTMGCNFDCPYCMQRHRAGIMSEETQDAVVALADRLLATSGARQLRVDWYGGEPLVGAGVMRRLYPLLKDVCTKHSAGLFSCVTTNGYLLNRQNVRLLGHCHTKLVRVTIDGSRETHDETRHLVGGGGTYDTIIENLSHPIPCPVEIRMNVHAGNLSEVDGLRHELDRIAAKTGNRFRFHPAEVFEAEAAQERGDTTELVGADELRMLSLNRGRMGLHDVTATHCPGQNPYDVCVDSDGGLYACQATLCSPERAFGNVWTWDPADPFVTAARPELLRWFKHDSWGVEQPECRACRWLPVCMGGCGFQRSHGRVECMPWKDDPEGFVLTQYARLGEKRRDRHLTPGMVARAAAPVLARHGVARAWVYGSVALGTARRDSDVDLIVEMPPGQYLGRGIFALRRELSEAFGGRQVDLHTPVNDDTDPSLVAFLRRNKVLVYEAG